ncbi:MAG: PAS domain-containing protein [Saprospiraceae bacterium]|nr:PAS domain-containing protein [Saprospiraceae bacterium]
MDDLNKTKKELLKELQELRKQQQGFVNGWNETATKITHLSNKEMLDKNIVETHITEHYWEQLKQVLDDALKGKETANYEFPLFTKDGKRESVYYLEYSNL